MHGRSKTELPGIRPFKVQVPQDQLDDLRRRLAATRWPDKETVVDQTQGAQLAMLQTKATRPTVEPVLAFQEELSVANDPGLISRNGTGGVNGLKLELCIGVAYVTPLAATSEAQYDSLLDTNVRSAFFSIQAVEPFMREGGSIILNTAWLNQVGVPGRAILSASFARWHAHCRPNSLAGAFALTQSARA
ncbi:NAD(P)-dependent dehydrogenase (short-subunit alcohol dehydrogenase family) [Bradyrhizobium sp. USDA 4486]